MSDTFTPRGHSFPAGKKAQLYVVIPVYCVYGMRALGIRVCNWVCCNQGNDEQISSSVASKLCDVQYTPAACSEEHKVSHVVALQHPVPSTYSARVSVMWQEMGKHRYILRRYAVEGNAAEGGNQSAVWLRVFKIAVSKSLWPK